ncbi:MAG: C39 family peptidase [Acholeplasmataceae bacterium]
MKKLFIILLLVFIITGCSNTTDLDELMVVMEEHIIIADRVDEDVDLPLEIIFQNETYDVIWESLNEDVMDRYGHIYQKDEDVMVTLKATVKTNRATYTMTFEVKVMKKENPNPFVKTHQYVKYASHLDSSRFNQLKLENDKLIIHDDHIQGSYESEVIEASLFKKMVGSWAATTNMDATVELQVRVMVDGQWSKYLSYRPWGFEKQNFSFNTTDDIARIAIDEIIVLNDKKAEKFQYKVILKRLNINIDSPKLDLISFALTIDNYSYKPNVEDLPNFIDYEVPMLNQQAVSEIGSSICSPTSAAMLLLYKGHDLYKKDELPHRYTAALFKDYGANVYGNWVFNTVGMSSFNEKAYVGMMYSFEELMRHLVEVGPVAASVSGDMGVYQTGGHLIVIRGYRITDDGDIFVLANDPNINSRFGNDDEGNPLFVYYEFPLETFMNTWKGIVYIIE